MLFVSKTRRKYYEAIHNIGQNFMAFLEENNIPPDTPFDKLSGEMQIGTKTEDAIKKLKDRLENP